MKSYCKVEGCPNAQFHATGEHFCRKCRSMGHKEGDCDLLDFKLYQAALDDKVSNPCQICKNDKHITEGHWCQVCRKYFPCECLDIPLNYLFISLEIGSEEEKKQSKQVQKIPPLQEVTKPTEDKFFNCPWCKKLISDSSLKTAFMQMDCRICEVSKDTLMFMECGHLVCRKCADQLLVMYSVKEKE